MLAAIRARIHRLGRRLLHGRLQDDADRMAVSVGIAVEHRSGGVHDAFTHAYSSARLTLRFGPTVARWLGDLNERIGSQAAGKHLEAEMDRHNNAVGRAIARGQRRDATRSGRETARRVREAVDAGALRVILEGRLSETRPPGGAR